MQLANTNRQFDTSVDSPIHQAQILATPQMFKILYDQLYTQKELAVVRELIANAWDAHVAAETTSTPINIHLPTIIEPWFEVRDFGTGLSKDDVIQLYMNYGSSNKTHTNSMIGGFGVGSKSPFAYTDQFTVVSHFNGMAYTFQAFLQQSGAPGCICVDERPTDEPNGLSVRVETRHTPSTLCPFKAGVTKIYPHIPVPPAINIEINKPFPPILTITPKHKVIQSISLMSGWADPTIIQGLVPYTIEWHTIVHEFTQLASPSAKIVFGRYRNIHLRVPIGTFEVTASREHLSLNDTTRDLLAHALADAYHAIYEEMTDRLSTSKTWFDWRQATESLHGAAGATGLPKHLLDPPLITGVDIRCDAITQGASPYVLQCEYYHKRRSGAPDIHTEQYKALHTGMQGATFFVREKETTPFKAQLINYYETQGHIDEHIYVIVGDPATIEANLEKVGFDCTVVPLPPPQRKQRQARPRYGSARYHAWIYDLDASDDTTPTHLHLPVHDLLTYIPANTILTTDFVQGALRALHRRNVFTAPFDKVCIISIPSSHNRVIERLRTDCEIFKDPKDVLSDVTWNEDELAWITAMNAIARDIGVLSVPSHIVDSMKLGDSHTIRFLESVTEHNELRTYVSFAAWDLPPDKTGHNSYDWLIDRYYEWKTSVSTVIEAFNQKHPHVQDLWPVYNHAARSWISAYFQEAKNREDRTIARILKE